MEMAERAFWLCPLEEADESWLAGLAGGEAAWLREPRIRGRVNAILVRRYDLGVGLGPIADPLLRSLALRSAGATRRLAWLASLCLAQRSLRQTIDGTRRGWVREVVGADMPFLSRRASLLWRDHELVRLPVVASAAELREALETVGVSAVAGVLALAAEPPLGRRVMLRFPAPLAQRVTLFDADARPALRRLFERLVEL